MVGREVPVRSDISRGGGLVSVAFWTALLTAAGMYGVVALAPKVAALEDLTERHHRRQWELIALEKEVSALRKTAVALDSDPRMARELARLEFGAVDPDEQRIPVEGPLALEIRASQNGEPSAVDMPRRKAPWYVGPLRVVAGHRALENTLLALAAGLVIYAFTFLRDGAEGEAQTVRVE